MHSAIGVLETVEKPGFAHAEWDKLTEVMIHRPGVEMFFGLLDPYAFLYERAFSMDEAIYEHRELEHVLGQSGAKVLRFKRVVIEIEEANPALFHEAREEAKRLVKFEGPKGQTSVASREFRKNVEELDAETIFNIILLRPSVRLEQGKGTRVIFPHPVLNVPLANLYFMRDQQALTDKGFVVGRMSKPQRMMEPSFTGRMLQLMGATIALHIKPPGTFEGGDFIPAGKFAMIGHGDRTNRNAVNQILEKGLDFEEVAVVRQATHPLIPGEERDPMINMHLDTYLNLAGQGIAVGCIPETCSRRDLPPTFKWQVHKGRGEHEHSRLSC
jgi:arginine deiminase